jgi:hypothetical protein
MWSLRPCQVINLITLFAPRPRIPAPRLRRESGWKRQREHSPPRASAHELRVPTSPVFVLGCRRPLVAYREVRAHTAPSELGAATPIALHPRQSVKCARMPLAVSPEPQRRPQGIRRSGRALRA